MMASFLGSTAIAEAFIIAFSLPNIFRRFFAEGALNSALVPMLSRHIKNRNNLKLLAGNIISWLLIVLILLVLCAEIFMPQFILAIASGFKGSEKFPLCISYGRIMFPYILLISIGSAYGAILNSLGYFKITAATPILLNISLIVALMMSNSMQFDMGSAITYAVPVAGVLQLLSIIIVCKSNHLFPNFYFPKITPDTRKFLLLVGPAVLAGGVVQINLLVGRQISSYFDGAVAWLNYADRIYQLPLGVIGIAIGVVLLPDLSRKFRLNDLKGAESAIHDSIVTSLFFVIPATIALLTIPNSIIRILFERGEFNSNDTIFTAQALFVFAIGLPAFVLQKIYSPIFFANNNTKTPFYFALIAMATNILISVALIPFFGFLATAIGTTVSSWILISLLIFSSKQYHLKIDKNGNLIRIIAGIFVCSLIMGIYLYIMDLYISQNFNYGLIKYVSFLFKVLSATLLYLLISYYLGILDFLKIKT